MKQQDNSLILDIEAITDNPFIQRVTLEKVVENTQWWCNNSSIKSRERISDIDEKIRQTLSDNPISPDEQKVEDLMADRDYWEQNQKDWVTAQEKFTSKLKENFPNSSIFKKKAVRKDTMKRALTLSSLINNI